MPDLDPTNPAAPAAAPPNPAAPAASGGSFKETIESVLIALILAFVFRAFVVEAFVIPTGSMAPTLMGAHLRYTCDDCGYRFDVGYQSNVQGEDLNIPTHALVRTRSGLAPRVYAIYCPNCGYKVPRLKPDDADNDATGPSVHYGDRILVLKYAYLIQPPRRWDVVVFKSPDDSERNAYQVNFIKRLVGLPGESILILDGDIYTSGNGGPWTVQTKPYAVQQALWRVVYDNDFYPRRLPREDGPGPWRQPWEPVENPDAWTLGDSPAGGRAFTFDSAAAGGTLRFDPEANPHANALTDWIAYDATAPQDQYGVIDTYLRPPRMLIAANVSDVKLQTWYQRLGGAGPLALRLSKLDDQFTAEIFPDRARLLRAKVGAAGGASEVLAEAPLPSGTGSAMQLEFTNVDYQVTLRVDGRVVLQSTPEQYQPDVPRLLEAYRQELSLPKPTIEISAAGQKARLTHLGVWRDVYYLNQFRGAGYGWATPMDFPARLMHLGEKEYFVLGDNSAVSKDARYWDAPIRLPDENLFVESGRVPERFLLGKAFFVYWPSGFRPGDNWPAIIPNFGDMRFIE